MKIVVEISEKDYLDFMLQYDNGILDEKTPSHRAKIAIAEGTPLPKDNDVLDKIRAEIVDLGQRTMNDNRASGIWACRNIIDKYKEGTEKV